jgi:hypothetical protein
MSLIGTASSLAFYRLYSSHTTEQKWSYNVIDFIVMFNSTGPDQLLLQHQILSVLGIGCANTNYL